MFVLAQIKKGKGKGKGKTPLIECKYLSTFLYMTEQQ